MTSTQLAFASLWLDFRQPLSWLSITVNDYL